ncbi:hypothetical protein JYT71_01315 [Acidimicrobiaceae bacterium AH-315-P05]|nr:hypothetical protein [Acidimicrobiaceae bacterium AH-315-P05]
MENFLSLVGAVTIGVFGSILAWLLTFRALRPSLEVSEHVSRVPAPDEYPVPHVYRVKVRNRRRKRQAIDLTVICQLAIRGVYSNRPTAVGVYELEFENNLPKINPGSTHTFWLRLLSNPDLAGILPDDLVGRVRDGSIRLEELLALPGAQLRFYVRCIDGFSAAPLLVERVYKAGAVKIGVFADGVCEMALGADAPSERIELSEDSALDYSNNPGPSSDSADD